MRHPEHAREPINLVLTDINPFTPRQQDFIKKILKGCTVEQAAEELGISIKTCGSMISGEGSLPDATLNKKRLGINGIIEKYTGERTATSKGWLMSMVRDVIVAESTLPREDKELTKKILDRNPDQLTEKEILDSISRIQAVATLALEKLS